MKNIILTIFSIFLGASVCLCQDQVVKITSERNDNIVNLFAENTSDEIYNIELTVISTGFKHVNNYPILKTVNPQEKKYITQIIAKKNEEASYNISLEYSKAQNKPKQNEQISKISTQDISKGIIIFTKDGCGRCKSVERFVKENNIEHTLLNITKNPNDNSLMWRTLADKGYSKKTVQTPVLIINGKIHYNVNDYNSLIRDASIK
jgi:glutaredoxin